MPITFVINDETKTNSHGFRVKNSGINLERFLANPVMLDQHWKSTNSVIGRWENIRTEGSQLLADAVFDTNDKDAAEIARKVEEGFIKGCSMGLLPISEGWQLIDGIPTLTLCELTEVSIVAVPSNSNAVKLYASEGVELEAEAIQLSINQITNPITVMKELKLTVATLVALGLQDTKDENVLAAAIENLADTNKQLSTNLEVVTADRDAKKQELDAIQKKERESLVDLAIQQGKITADKREEFITLASTNVDLAKSILDALQPKVNLGVTNTPGSNGAQNLDFIKITSLDDLQKLPTEKILAFKEQHPEKYQSIITNK